MERDLVETGTCGELCPRAEGAQLPQSGDSERQVGHYLAPHSPVSYVLKGPWSVSKGVRRMQQRVHSTLCCQGEHGFHLTA